MSDCVIDNCDKPVHVKKYGWCSRHYQRWSRYGDPLGGYKPQYAELCSFEDCRRARRYQDLCMGHWTQRRKGQPLSPLRKLTDPTTRDEHGRKQCRRCAEWKPEADFSTNKARRDALTAYCRRCERDKALIHNYGITLDQYEKLLADQGGGCAICGGLNSTGRPLAVDHDHACCPNARTCGKCVRGLLCSDCNLGIGYFHDQIDRLQAATAYLRGTP